MSTIEDRAAAARVAPLPRPVITPHAIVRWLERAEGRDLGVSRRAFERTRGCMPTDPELLAFLGAYTGETITDIADRIDTPSLRQAIALGAARVRRGAVFLVIDGGVVTTVLRRRREVVIPRRGPDRTHGPTKGRTSQRAWNEAWSMEAV